MVVIVFNDTFYFLIWPRFFGSCKGKWNSFSIKCTERNSVTKKKKWIVHSSWLVSTFHILRSSSLNIPHIKIFFTYWWLFIKLLWTYRRRQWHPTPVLLPGKSHGWRSLVGCSPWGRRESDTTERLDFHFSLSCIGEGNGNPLHCSCLENPRDGGAWWAAGYGVAQSRTRLKWLSSSSSGWWTTLWFSNSSWIRT